MEILCLAPKGFEFNVSDERFQPKYNGKRIEVLKDNMAYLIHTICVKAVSSDDGSCILQSAILQKWVEDYKRYIDYLVEIKLITVSNSYMPGQESKTYRLNKDLRDKQLVIARRITSMNFIKRYSKNYSKVEIKSTRPNLEKWFNHLLTVDMQQADEILDELQSAGELKVCKDYHLHRLQMMQQSKKFSTGKTCRYYTPISNIKSELRAALRYDKKELVEIDITNSLPFILSRLFTPIIENRNIKSNINKYIKDKDILLIYVKEISRKDDIIKYSRMVETGNLYYHLAAIWNNKLKLQHTIKTAKKKLNSILNQIPHQRDSREKAVLREEFPTLIEFCDYLYHSRVCTLYQHPLPLILQEIEANFILDEVCGELTDQYRDVPIYTLHDSVMTTYDYKDVVERVIKETGKNYFGVEPKIKITNHRKDSEEFEERSVNVFNIDLENLIAV